MKKCLLIVLLIIECGVSYSAIPKPIKVRIEYEIGKPLDPDCKGLGICYIISAGSRATSPGYLEYDNNIAICYLSKAEMSEDDLNDFEKNDFIPIDDDFKLSSDLVSQLLLKPDSFIPKGVYSINSDSEFYIIRFPIEQ